jgi:hypothetical protein
MRPATKYRRRSIRLKGYDYSRAGAYFVTLCTRRREMFFDVPEIRHVAEKCWLAIPDHAANVELDGWVIMQNHLHGIIVIDARGGVQLNAFTAMNTPMTMNAPKERNPDDPFSVMSPRREPLSVILRTHCQLFYAPTRPP